MRVDLVSGETAVILLASVLFSLYYAAFFSRGQPTGEQVIIAVLLAAVLVV